MRGDYVLNPGKGSVRVCTFAGLVSMGTRVCRRGLGYWLGRNRSASPRTPAGTAKKPRSELRSGRFPRYSYADLENDGYRFIRSPASYDIAAVHAIGFGTDGEPFRDADIVYGVGMARLM